MHCGWMPREEWAVWRTPQERGLPPAIGPVTYDLDVCPGWLVRQPAVVEAAQAHAAYDKGSMETFFPEAASSLLEGVQAMSQSLNRFQSWKLKESRRKDTLP